MLIGGMIDHQFRDDPQAPLVGGAEKRLEILQPAVARMDVAVFGDIVAVVPERGRIKRQQPYRRHP